MGEGFVYSLHGYMKRIGEPIHVNETTELYSKLYHPGGIRSNAIHSYQISVGQRII